MADNEKVGDHDGQKTERNIGRSCTGRIGKQRALSKMKYKVDESELPSPPPDPWASPWRSQNSRNQAEIAQSRNFEEDEDIIAYLTDLGTLPFEGQTSECPSRNSATSAMTISNFYVEDAFEHLDRLYAFAEEILELRNRNSKFFKRVRNLERLKTLRNANNKLENTFARDKDAMINICEEDTGFAESLLDAMLSNCRDSPFQKRNIRSSSSRQTRDKFDVEKQLSVDEISRRAPKVSKWTRVKAAFKWERAYTNDTEIIDPSMATIMATTTTTTTIPLLSPTTKCHRVSDEIRESNNTANSPPINETCDLGTPFDRTTSLCSSNEGFYDNSQKNILNHLDDQSLKKRTNKKAEYANCHNESLDNDIVTLDTLQVNETGPMNEVGQGNSKSLLRITSEKSHTMHSSNRIDEKDTELTSKRSTPTLMITIPSQEEDIRYTSSPETNSPLFFGANSSGGSFSQHRKTYRDLSTNKDFKRQQSFGGESVILTSKMQRQDSKWNKVRRAFLTNSALSVPSNLINVVPRQTLFQDGSEASISSNYDDTVENTEKPTSLNGQIDRRQDYRALREKLGTEFHQKLIEWERLKNLSPRSATKDSREISSNLSSPRESLLSEERLAPEFKKKLQDWKRTKKIRRGSAPFEQQRISRRRLTDWQLWRSPMKSEYKNKEFIGSQACCESGEIINDGKSQFYEDFTRKMESWKGISETNSHDPKSSTRSKLHQVGNASGIDESEFIALERLLSLFNNNTNKGRRESDAQQLDECFDGYVRSYTYGTQNTNDTNEILVRTSVGSYRFEGISREFTRKLYDWERYRGISPTSSTFRLLGPAYIPFLRQATIEASTDDSSSTKVTSDEPVLLKVCGLKRSKSVGNLIERPVQNEFFIRRSNSLQSLNHLTNRLKNADRLNTFQESIDPQRTEDIMDDSEPEAMIVDIEDVIEETASPLERVQPHQTPVYSVATSETTSIAVPLGTVTSSHEPSPVCLIEIEENADCKHWEPKSWNQRKSFSSDDSLSMEQCETTKTWNNENNSSYHSNMNSENSSVTSSSNKKRMHRIKDNTDNFDRELDKDSMKSNSSINSIEVDSEYNVPIESKKMANQNHANFDREDIPMALSYDKHATEITAKKYVSDETNENKTVHEWNLGNRSIFGASIKETMELLSEKAYKEQCDDREVAKDENSNNEKDTAKTTIKYNEYEELTPGACGPYYCSLINMQAVENYNEEVTKTFPETSTACKLDEAKHTACSVEFCDANQENENLKKLEKNYSATRDKLHDSCRDSSKIKLDLNKSESSRSCIEYSDYDKRNNCSKAFATSARLMEKKEWQEFRNVENVSTPLTLRTTNSCIRDYRRKPTIQTTAYTVVPCREERCFERIIINEETLNKIVVPTASTGCVEEVETSKQPVGYSTTEDSTEEHHHRSNSDRDISINQETIIKKQISSSPTRNVLIKTKRIIFSPFRRSEEHSAGKKENNISENDHVLPMKNKSKSRSGSPKINRQDALLRMSLSLPWPLRPLSKEREMKERKDEGSVKEKQICAEKRNFERCKSVENSRKSSDSENSVFEAQTNREIRILRDKNSSIELPRKNSELKHSTEEKNQRTSVSVQTIPNKQQNQASFRVSLPSLKTEEKTKETMSCSRFDPQSSDLIHKLTILSNAVAKRDGRTNTISENSSPESHSLRIRRAKEDFLSRRGGPLCHSVQESPSPRNENSLKTSSHYYERILENQEKIENKIVSNINHVFNTFSDEISSNSSTQEESSKEKKRGQFINEYNVNELSNNSIASRPDRVKSASAGMINVDPDVFVRLTEANRGCESLPRSISKQQQPLGSFAKIVNKFKFSRLMRSRDIQAENMSTISKLCRQSLLIDVRNDFEKSWETNDREKSSKMVNIEKIKKKK